MKLILSVYDILKKRKKPVLSRLKMLLMILITVFHFSGCSSAQQTDLVSPTIENKPTNSSQEKVEKKQINNIADPELERNRRFWLENKIVNYNITVYGSRGGNVVFAKVLIEVRDGKGTLIEPTPEVGKIRLEIYKDLDTIDKMFDAIREGLEKGAKVEVKYNKKFGYPENFRIDYIKLGTDAWFGMKIENFEIVKSN